MAKKTGRSPGGDETGADEQKTDSVDLEALLAKKKKLDDLIRDKFTRSVTVMFTDLSGSTQMAEELGDMAIRMLLKQHNDIIFPLVEMNAGHLVKTMGDGTMSYFDDACDAVRAAIAIEEGIERFNHDTSHPPLYIRCGLNTGVGIVEKNDVNGDVVNVAARFEAMAEPLEILLSEETYKNVTKSDAFTIRFHKQTRVRGKAGPQNVYKVFWGDEPIPEENAPKTDKRALSDQDISNAVTGDIIIDPDAQPLPSGSDTSRVVKPIARIKIIRKGHEADYHNLEAGTSIIGRSSEADIKIPELFLSRRHAKIEKVDGAHYVEDLNSHIGTQLNGEKVTRARLAHNDVIAIGGIELTYIDMARGNEEKEEELAAISESETTLVYSAGNIMTLNLLENNKVKTIFEVTADPQIIGRQEGVDIRLQSPLISRRHATVQAAAGKIHIEDMGSNNGTYLRGGRVDAGDAEHGDQIRIGPFTLQVIDPIKPPPEISANPNQSAAELGEKMVGKVLSFLKKK